jgi:nucleoside phosphorylase
MRPSQPRDRGDFEVAIICALQSEADAVEALFDKSWGNDGEMYGKAPGDTNAYTTGMIGLHNVVLAHMPKIGKKSAASVASSFRSSFGGIKLALLVGICGGVPQGNDGEEILLGDVIISDGLIEYDFGRQYPDKFARKDTLGQSVCAQHGNLITISQIEGNEESDAVKRQRLSLPDRAGAKSRRGKNSIS